MIAQGQRHVSFPNAAVVSDCPVLPADALGVRIAGPAMVSREEPFILAGTFLVPEREEAGLGDHPHRALVLVVWREPLYSASAPFRRVMLFGDDVLSTPAGRLGRFSLSVFEHCGFRTPGTWYVSIALGEWLSNTLEVEVL